MKELKNLLKNLERAVVEHDSPSMKEAVAASIKAGVPKDDIRRALSRGLERRRTRMMTDEAPLPRFLICLDVVHEGLDMLSSPKKGKADEGVPLVIGVVEGDPHDLGKNIVSRVYAASGYNVRDLGRGVSPGSFLRAIEEHRAEVLALSAMMSTTMSQMPGIIRLVRERFPSVVVMAGGAPLDANLAGTFGADGYAGSAATLLEETGAAIKKGRGRKKR